MNLKIRILLFTLVLGTLTGAVTLRVFAQEKTQEAEKKPALAQWATVPKANLKLGYAEGWQLSGKSIKQATSPDNQVRFAAYVSLHNTATEAVEHLGELLGEQVEGLELTDPQEGRECHDLKVLSTGGHGKTKEGTALDVAVDIVESPSEDHKIVVIIMMGVHDAMAKNAADIILTQESYQKAE